MAYFETVEMVQIKTGDLFTSESKAENFIIDKISEEINELLKTQEYENLKYRDLVKVINALCGNIASAERLKSILDTYLD